MKANCLKRNAYHKLLDELATDIDLLWIKTIKVFASQTIFVFPTLIATNMAKRYENLVPLKIEERQNIKKNIELTR